MALGTEAWIQTYLLGYIAMLGLYILSSLERMYSPSIAMYPSNVDTDTFARVHSNARTVHPLFSRKDVQSEHCYVP